MMEREKQEGEREQEWERGQETEREREQKGEKGKAEGENNKGSLFVLFCSEKEGKDVLPFWDWLTEIEAAVCECVCIRQWIGFNP